MGVVASELKRSTRARNEARVEGEETVRMDVQGANLFGVELPEPIAAVVRKVEALAERPIQASTSDSEDVAPVMGYFAEDGTPTMKCGPEVTPDTELLALEVLRLELRKNIREDKMPYAEMRHESNRRLCKWLYRIMEQEILMSVAQSHGLSTRDEIQTRLEERMLVPLENGSYRDSEEEVLRARQGALDGLEFMISMVDTNAAMRALKRIADADSSISRQLGLMYKIVQNHRPFENAERVTAAYYLTVPFLFDTRTVLKPKPAAEDAPPKTEKRKEEKEEKKEKKKRKTKAKAKRKAK
ncbi:hypothetical protein ACFL59_15225 [Planctomycetota bacterium]